jgi:hypothetical protein
MKKADIYRKQGTEELYRVHMYVNNGAVLSTMNEYGETSHNSYIVVLEENLKNDFSFVENWRPKIENGEKIKLERKALFRLLISFSGSADDYYIDENTYSFLNEDLETLLDLDILGLCLDSDLKDETEIINKLFDNLRDNHTEAFCDEIDLHSDEILKVIRVLIDCRVRINNHLARVIRNEA